MNRVKEVTEEQFGSEVLQASVPVLVDFFAPWCGPCKMLAPYLEQIAGEYEGRVKFVKVDVDEAQGLAVRYEITGVPTLALFHKGNCVDTLVGLVSGKALKAWIEKSISETRPASHIVA